jgi:hypothetical protein
LLGFSLTLCILIYILSKTKIKVQISLKLVLKVILLSIFAALLPLIHFHSFIALIIICAVLFVYNIKNYKFYLTFAAVTGLLSFIVWSAFYSKGITESPISIRLGWMANKENLDVNFIYFWILNWGMFLPLAIIGTIAFKLYKNSLVMSGVVLFTVCNLVLFQQYDWDNSKILIYAYLFLTIPVIKTLSWLISKNMTVKLFTILLFLTLVFSAFVDSYRLYNNKKLAHELYSKESLDTAKTINAVINSGDVVLTGLNHNNLVAGHTKGQILAGYPGWLWSYGFDYISVTDDVKAMYQGKDSNLSLFNKYSIKYILVGPSERSIKGFNQEFFDFNFKPIIENNTYTFYKVL